MASDPIGFELFRNTLLSIADEMALTILRTAYSGVLRDNMDYSTAFCDGAGRTVAQGLTLPAHLSSFPDALATLQFLPHRAARSFAKVVKSAAANAETNFNLDPTELYIVRVTADKGRILKRFRPKARGRVGPILKRSSHLTVVVAERG